MDDDDRYMSDGDLTPEEIAAWWSATCCHTYAVDANGEIVVVEPPRFSALRRFVAGAATAVLVVSALAVLLVSFDLFPFDRTGSGDPTPTGIPAADWARLTSAGHAFGPHSAPVVILVFGDYQCVHCRTLNLLVDSLISAYPTKIRFVFRHLPLPPRPYAYVGAHAAVCAGEQGKFWDMHRLLMAKQDSFATLSLADLGSRAGVPDRGAFIGCAGGSRAMSRISADVADAEKLGASGTPAVFVNGVASVPGSLRRAVKFALESRGVDAG